MRWRIVLGGGVAVVTFDVLAALAARTFDFDYGLAGWVSLLIYGVFGYAAARAGGGLRASALTGAAVALVDATAGWAVSVAIGPGRLEGATAFVIAVTLVVVVLIGGLMGWIGGRLAGRFGRRAPAHG